MSDPLFDPLPDVLAEFGESLPDLPPLVLPPAPPPSSPRSVSSSVSAPPHVVVTPPTAAPSAAGPATFTVPDVTITPAAQRATPQAPAPVHESSEPVAAAKAEPVVAPIAAKPAPPLPSWADLSDIRDGLAGMRTDLRQVPEQVGQTISGTVLNSVSVALSDVRRPLESIALITEQLGAILARLDTVSGMREQVTLLDGVPQAIEASREQMARELGGLASDLAALLTRVTGIDGRLVDMGSTLDAARALVAEVEGRMAALDSSIAEVAASAINAEHGLREAIHDEVGRAVRDQLRDLVRDGVHDGVSGTLDDTLQAKITEAVSTAQTSIEARMRTHVDEAVLQLAEVLMRRQADVAEAVPPRSATAAAPKSPAASKSPAKPGAKAPAKAATKAVPKERAAPKAAAKAPAKPKAPPKQIQQTPEVDEDSEVERLIDRQPEPKSLADAIADAVRSSALDQVSEELGGPEVALRLPPVEHQVVELPGAPRPVASRPIVDVPPPSEGAPGVEDILATWNDPTWRHEADDEEEPPPPPKRRFFGRSR